MKPLISIITPAYNAESFIGQTIESVIAQTYQTWEHLIVVDIKSADQTRKIASKYAEKDARIILVDDPTATGVAANRNLAIKKAQGEFLAFLDADDLWAPEKLEKQIHFMLTNNANFTFHSYQHITFDGHSINTFRQVPQNVTYRQLLGNNCIGCLTVMLKNEGPQKIQFKDEFHEDFCLWLDLLKNNTIAFGITESLAYYRQVAASRSDDKKRAAIWRWQILRQREKLNLIRSSLYFLQYAFTAMFRRI